MLVRFLTAILFLSITSTGAWAQSDKISLEGRTAERAAAGERVRVIVDFIIAAPDLPAGVDARLARQTVIANTRTAILDRAFGADQARAMGADYAAGGKAVKTGQPVIARTLHNAPALAMYLTRAEMEKLADDSMVRNIYTDRLSRPSLNESTVLIGAPVVWAAGSDGADFAVAVLDTGSSHDHTMMTGKVVGSACFSTTDAGQNAVSFCPDGSNAQLGLPAGTNCPVDDPATTGTTEGVNGCFHGTHVAATAMGSIFTDGAGNTVEGVARGANLVAIQVFTKFTDSDDCDGDAPCILSFGSDQQAGLDFVLDNAATMKIASANMSLGGGEFPNTCDGSQAVMKSLIDQLRAAGVATVIAAGNEGFTNAVSSPGCISTAVTVGATSKQDVVAGFSNSSPMVDLLAPGVSIRAAYPHVGGTSYSTGSSGTSMATPHVAGAFALLKSANPTATVQEIEDALKATGKPVLDTKNQLYKPRIRVDLANDLLGNGGGAGIGNLAIAPADGFFSIGDPGNSPSFGSKTYTLTNNTGANATWTAAADKSFIILNNSGGTLAAGASDTVVVSVDAAILAGGGEGSDDGSLTFTFGADTSIRAIGASAFIPPPPPLNNNFANALPLFGLQPSITGSSADADKEAGEPNHQGGTNTGGASVWYKWVAPISALIQVGTEGSNFDTVLGVYTGNNVSSLVALANNDDVELGVILHSLLSFNAVKGNTYFIAIDGFNGISGDIVLGISASGAPANDNFASGTAISGAMGNASTHNISASAEASEPAHGGSPASASIWFDWTAPSSGDFVFNTDGSDFDTVLAVYTGAAVNALTEVASNDNQGAASASSGKPLFTAGASQVSFTATSGTVYHIAVDGKSGASGLVNLDWVSSATALPNLVTAVLPYARSVQIGTQATAFMTVINAGTVGGTNCSIDLSPGAFQGGFSYQTTDAGNVAIGIPDTPVDIAGNNGVQSFVFAVTPSVVLNQVELGIQANCDEGTSSNVAIGVNSFILSSAADVPADMLTIGLTATGDGVVSIPGSPAAEAAAIATAALGADATLTLSADDGGKGLPLSLFVCETNSTTGLCLANPTATLDISSVNGETRTFSVFANATGSIPFDPGNNRFFVRFKDVGGIVRGATSFAVRTDAP